MPLYAFPGLDTPDTLPSATGSAENREVDVRGWIIAGLLLLNPNLAPAQIRVEFTVDTDEVQGEISPLVYGTNYSSLIIAPANRSGGNRWTGYNWEQNASHAGADWYHHNDNYLPWIMGIPSALSDEPGIVLTTIHERNLARDAYSLITLPMAGYAARDKNGEVTEPEAAPSPRWVAVVDRKGAPFSFPPDTTDGALYIDEQLDFLIGRFGPAGSADGIEAYALDNEPALWTSTHPRIFPQPLTVAELMERTRSLSAVIKNMDPAAEVYGPSLYGFNAYLNLQDAPDWGDYSGTYDRFIDAYLDIMRMASDTAGVRLLDVLDVHWYPEPAGVYSGDTTRTVAETRMQVTRSLWDPTYIEDSWIGQWFSPVAILVYLQDAIASYFAGTQLAITEYDYGAPDHISGGIAQVDALGIFGRFKVYFGSKWGAVDEYIRSAYRLYLDYDGVGGQFGDLAVAATTADIENTSLYAALSDDQPSRLHLVLVNKNYDEAVAGHFQVRGPALYTHGESWGFTRSDTLIIAGPAITVDPSNAFDFELPPLSAHHVVLFPQVSEVDAGEVARVNVIVRPDPGRRVVCLTSPDHAAHIGDVAIFDATGRQVLKAANHSGARALTIDGQELLPGTYILRARIGGEIVTRKFMWVR